MINGYPFDPGSSFFAQYLKRLGDAIQLPIESQVFSFGGFPVERASRFLHRVAKYEPQMVVLQFGSTDLTISLKNHLLPKMFRRVPLSSGSSSNSGKCRPHGAYRSTPMSRFQERIKFQLCRTLNVKPEFGDTQTFMLSIDRICSSLRASSIEPVVLAPFPHGDRTSNLWARKFSNALDDYTRSRQILFVDAHAELGKVPKETLLLSDKLHLSEQGHRILGELLLEKTLPLATAIGRLR